MAKLSKWERGLKGGAVSLSSKESATLGHVEYNSATDIVETDRPLQTTLNSFYLGDQHKISSGAENIFFTNRSSDIDWYPLWGGVKNQALEENRGPDGVIAGSCRVYSDYLAFVSLDTGIGTGVSTYNRVSLLEFNTAGVGIRTITEVDITPDIFLHYKIHYILEDGSLGRLVYKQVLTGLDLKAGDFLEWFFDHPVEIHKGTLLVATIEHRRHNDPSDTDFILPVRANADGDKGYAEVMVRTYTDKDIAFKDDIGISEFALADIHDEKYSHSLHLSDLQILTDDFGEPILFTSRYDGMDEGDSEWSMVHLMTPIPATLHLRSNEVLTDNTGIPIVFSN